MQLAEAQQKIERALLSFGLEASEAEAETRWILDHLGFSTLTQRVSPGQLLAPLQWEQAQALLARRQLHEPLQYILGNQPFCGLLLKVTPAVLIPRPETEELVHLALNTLPAIAEALRIADFGAGSGAIALALAHELQKRRQASQIWASDLSAAALALAAENALLNHLDEAVIFLEGDGLDPFLALGLELDLLISNPPYVPLAQWQTLAPEVQLYEPQMALTPGEDPLRFYRLLAEQGPRLLRSGGQLWLELETSLASETQSLFLNEDWVQVRLLPDFAGQMRFLNAIRV